jgi:hypothetical protein
MHREMYYKFIIILRQKQKCSKENISLILLKTKILKRFEFRSHAKRSTCLSSAVCVVKLSDLAVTLMIIIW